MAATFTRPLPFVVLASDALASAPASNANDDRPGRVWRSSGSTRFVILDLGASPSYDLVAIVGSNLSANDSVRVQTGTSTAGTGSFDRTIPAMTGIKPLGFSTKTIIPIGTRTERYVRIDITTAAATLEVQRIVVGPSISTLGIDYDADQSVLDTSNFNSNLGTDSIEMGLMKIRWKLSMSSVVESEWRASWLGWINQVGKRIPILFVPFDDRPQDWQADAIFGRIRNDVPAKIIGLNTRSVEMTIEGLAT